MKQVETINENVCLQNLRAEKITCLFEHCQEGQSTFMRGLYHGKGLA